MKPKILRTLGWAKKHIAKSDRLSLAFVVTALVFGTFFVYATPLLWGADETTHVGKVYQLSHGQIFAEKVQEGYVYDAAGGYGFGGEVPIDLKRLIDYVNRDFNVNENQITPGIKWVDNAKDYDKFKQMSIAGNEKVDYNFSNTAIYSPLAYVPSVLGFKIAEMLSLKLGATIYLARLFDLFFYVGVVWYTLKALRYYAFKWVIFVIALLPSALFQASIITADTVTIALALAVVGLVVKGLLAREVMTRAEVCVLVVCAALLPVVKPSYLLISFLVLLIPVTKIPFKWYRPFIMPATVLIGLVLFALWQMRTRYLEDASKFIIAGVVPWWQSIDESEQIKFILHNPIETFASFVRTVLVADNLYLDSLFGRLGFNYVPIPGTAILASCTALVMSVAHAEVFKRTRKVSILLPAIIIGTIGLIFGIFYITITEVGAALIQGVQGRYFLPLLPVTLLLIAYFTRIRLRVPSLSYRNFAFGVFGIVLFSLMLAALKYHYVTWG